MVSTLVKTYTNGVFKDASKKYQQDAKKLNADGYRVVSVVPARKFMKGFVLVVTYERFSTGH